MTYSLPKLFPHFPQLKPARLFFGLEMTFLWIALIALFAVNLLAKQALTPLHWKPLVKLFETPSSVSRHIDLASLLWQQGQKDQARNLMVAAQLLSTTGRIAAGEGGTVNVLGLTTSPADTLAQWEHERDQWDKQYAFWQSVAITKPDYRDAYITLASLAYQLGKLDESKRWLSQARTLDPNHPTAQKLSDLLKGI
ncbi:MAG: hypothetical protein AAB557_02425 [Patescibacteria group bacterium]